MLLLLVLLVVPEGSRGTMDADAPSLLTFANNDGLRPMLLLPTEPRGLFDAWLERDEILSPFRRSNSSTTGPSARALSSSYGKSNLKSFFMIHFYLNVIKSMTYNQS